jgi:hypothetical protein
VNIRRILGKCSVFRRAQRKERWDSCVRGVRVLSDYGGVVSEGTQMATNARSRRLLSMRFLRLTSSNSFITSFMCVQQAPELTFHRVIESAQWHGNLMDGLQAFDGLLMSFGVLSLDYIAQSSAESAWALNLLSREYQWWRGGGDRKGNRRLRLSY